MIYLRTIILTEGHLFIYGVHDHAHLWKQDKQCHLQNLPFYVTIHNTQ
jgi:hypothetical protein